LRADKPYDREFAGVRNSNPFPAPTRIHGHLQVGRNDLEGYFFYVMEAAMIRSQARKLTRQRTSQKL